MHEEEKTSKPIGQVQVWQSSPFSKCLSWIVPKWGSLENIENRFLFSNAKIVKFFLTDQVSRNNWSLLRNTIIETNSFSRVLYFAILGLKIYSRTFKFAMHYTFSCKLYIIYTYCAGLLNSRAIKIANISENEVLANYSELTKYSHNVWTQRDFTRDFFYKHGQIYVCGKLHPMDLGSKTRQADRLTDRQTLL